MSSDKAPDAPTEELPDIRLMLPPIVEELPPASTTFPPWPPVEALKVESPPESTTFPPVDVPLPAVTKMSPPVVPSAGSRDKLLPPEMSTDPPLWYTLSPTESWMAPAWPDFATAPVDKVSLPEDPFCVVPVFRCTSPDAPSALPSAVATCTRPVVDPSPELPEVR